MAKLFGEIAAKSILTLDKAFARANGQPLDSSEIYYSLAAAEAYAQTDIAYIGQKIVVIENDKVTHYSIEDAAGTLKEVGSKPVGDTKTVSIAEDGTISLANIPETGKDEDGNDIPATYNAVLVNGVLTWVKPSATTVEGLSDLIETLTGRVDTAEGEIDTLQSAVGVAATEGTEATGLFKAIADEIARATGAEEDLGERIDAIDFIDDSELAEAIKDFATTNYVDEKFNAVEHPVVGVSADDKILALGADKLLSATVSLSYDETTSAIKLTGKDGVELGSVDATPFIKDGMLSDVEYDAETNTLTFTWNTDSGEKTDSVILSDIIEPYTAGNGLNLESNAFSVKVVADDKYLTVDSTGLHTKDIDTAISTAVEASAEELRTSISGVQTYAEGIADDVRVLGERADGVDEELETIAGSISTITEEIDGIKTDVSTNYLKSTDAASTYATKDELKTTDDKTVSNANSITNLTNRIDNIVAQGGEPNTINTIKVNGTVQTIDSEKAVDIKVPTKFSEITDDSGFDSRITAAQNKADEAANAAAAAQSTADGAAAQATTNKSNLDTLTSTVSGHTTTIADHGTRLVAAETTISEQAGKITTIEGNVAKKADQTALDALAETVGTNTGNITSLTERVSANETAIGTKANASEVYTKIEVNAITGTPTEGKTLVQMIADAQTAATYDDTEVKASIKSNADAIAILNGVTAESTGDTGKSVRTITAEEIAKVVAGAPADFDTLKEVADWIANDTTGAAAMQSDISDLKNIVNGIGGTDEPATVMEAIAAAAPEIATTSVAGLVLASTAENAVNVDETGVMTVNSLNVNKLVQTEGDELILNGGNA